MLDPQLVRSEPETIKQIVLDRNMDPKFADVDRWLDLDSKRTSVLQQVEELNKKKNELAAMGKQGVSVDEIRETGKKIKEESKAMQEELAAITEDWTTALHSLPNVLIEGVPLGKDEEENVVLREVGDKPNFDFKPKDHLEIGEDLGILDFQSGAKVSGSKFYYLKGDLVRLEFALLQYGIDFFYRKRI